MKNELEAVIFQDVDQARAFLEAARWPNGPVCPHCGAGADRVGKLANQRTKTSKAHPEGKLIIGLYKCYACREKFTVRVGTIFEDSHAPLNLWLHDVAWWHVELLPRLTVMAGLELGAGVYVNTLDPAEAARELREAG